ncbi:MAG TPA: cytochrome c oxidase subunit II [Gemmatimonadaceae bacterium]
MQNPLSLFSSSSDAAARITTLTWFMIVLSTLIFIGVVAVMIAAVLRNRHRDAAGFDLSEPKDRFVLWGGAIIPGIVLVALFVVGLGAMRRFSPAPPAVTIRVTGHQWWWQADYLAADGRLSFRTANEIHIPVDQVVRIILTSSDVIHSFWVPQLQGKMDAIPGDTTDLRLHARQAGIYGGACSEYCGEQHAHMAFVVVVDSAAAYQAWLARQVSNAAPPSDSTTTAGHQLFVTTECAQCHAVRGTSARAELGPDLTHIGSRLTIAAGTRPNSLGNLAGWIANPQALKPGTKMPTLRTYTGPELRALAAYLTALK